MAQPTVHVADNDEGYARILRELRALSRAEVLIGFQESAITHAQSRGDHHKEAGQSIAQIAYDNEFGTRRIPSRSFMRTAFDQNRQRLIEGMERQYNLILEGRSTAREVSNRIGLFMQSLIQRRIREIRTPPNSPYTIALKRSSKPLIDFGQMVNAVSYVVIRRQRENT